MSKETIKEWYQLISDINNAHDQKADHGSNYERLCLHFHSQKKELMDILEKTSHTIKNLHEVELLDLLQHTEYLRLIIELVKCQLIQLSEELLQKVIDNVVSCILIPTESTEHEIEGEMRMIRQRLQQWGVETLQDAYKLTTYPLQDDSALLNDMMTELSPTVFSTSNIFADEAKRAINGSVLLLKDAKQNEYQSVMDDRFSSLLSFVSNAFHTSDFLHYSNIFMNTYIPRSLPILLTTRWKNTDFEFALFPLEIKMKIWYNNKDLWEVQILEWIKVIHAEVLTPVSALISEKINGGNEFEVINKLHTFFEHYPYMYYALRDIVKCFCQENSLSIRVVEFMLYFSGVLPKLNSAPMNLVRTPSFGKFSGGRAFQKTTLKEQFKTQGQIQCLLRKINDQFLPGSRLLTTDNQNTIHFTLIENYQIVSYGFASLFWKCTDQFEFLPLLCWFFAYPDIYLYNGLKQWFEDLLGMMKTSKIDDSLNRFSKDSSILYQCPQIASQLLLYWVCYSPIQLSNKQLENVTTLLNLITQHERTTGLLIRCLTLNLQLISSYCPQDLGIQNETINFVSCWCANISRSLSTPKNDFST